MKVPLTQERLKELLHYDPDTGVFTWKIGRRCVRAGSVAGSLCWQGYRHIETGGKSYMAHRLAWIWLYGPWPADQIDHISGDRDDNRISNLRGVDGGGNAKNQKIGKKNTTGIIGVSWNSAKGKFRAAIGLDNKKIYLGDFSTLSEARASRKAAERKYGYHENHGRSVV